MAALDGSLLRRSNTIADADRRALSELEAAGFFFPNIAAAIAYQDKQREATRFAADLVEISHTATRRDAAHHSKGLTA